MKLETLVAQRKNIAGNGLNGKPVKPSVENQKTQETQETQEKIFTGGRK